MAAKIGLGTVIAYETTPANTYLTLAEVSEFSGTSITVDTVDSTDFSHVDGFRRFIASLADSGEVSFKLNYDPSLTVYAALDTILKSRLEKRWKFTYAGTTVNTVVTAILTGLGRETPLDDKMQLPVTLKVSGPMTEATV